MPVKANNFIWIDKVNTPNNVIEDVLNNIQDTDESKEPNDSRLTPLERENIIMNEEEGLTVKRSQYTEDMMGESEDRDYINKENNKKE